MTDLGPLLPRGGDTVERAHALENVSASLLAREPEHQRLGRYVLLEREGSGGMGVVFSAYDPQLDRKVALKLLQRAKADAVDDRARAEVLREARAMARLSHPYVVTVHEVGEHRDRIFLAMEYVSGGTLREWMQNAARPWAEVVRMFIRAGRGLAAAHEAGLVHRDFKPENVLVTASGEPRVADFGLARMGSVDDSSAEVTAQSGERLTTDGAWGGTPAYMAPEVFAGQPANAASDQFSFCVALFEALFGQRPFAGDALGVLLDNVARGRVEDPTAAASVPGALRRVVVRGLAVAPEDRFASMAALSSALESFVDPPSTRGWWAAGGLAVALGGLATWTATRDPGATPEPCGGGEQRAAAAWSADAGHSLAQSVGASPAQAQRLLELGDAYASRWANAYREACLDTAVRKVQTERHLEARMLCLDGQLRAFSGAQRAIESQPGEGAETALDVLEHLPDVEVCADPRRLDAQSPGRDRDAVLQVEEELGRARALEQFHRPEEAIDIVRVQLSHARALGEDRLLAEALLYLAVMEVRSGEAGRARPHIDEARLVSERAGLDRFIVEALILSSVDAQMHRELEQAQRDLDLAQAVLERYGGDPKFEASIEARLGTLAYDRGELETAVDHYRRQLIALEALQLEGGEGGISALINLGLALRDHGRHDEALRSLEEARRRSIAGFGAENPGLPVVDLHIAMVLEEQDRFDEALVALRRGLEVAAKTRGPESADAVQLHAGFALVFGRVGRHAESLEHSLEGVRVLEVLEQEHSPDMMMCLGYAADALVQLGRAEEALPLHERALTIGEGLFGSAHPEVASALVEMAAAQLATGDRAAARDAYERALGILVAAERPPEELADVRRSLAELGGE